MDLSRDFARLTEKLKQERSVEIPLRVLESEEEVFVFGLTTKALAYINSVHLEPSVHLALSEILRNAEKAILKRVHAEYFEKDVMLESPDFLKSFSARLANDPKSLRTIAKKGKSQFSFKILFQSGKLLIQIRNNGDPNPTEKALIQASLGASKRATDLMGMPELITHEGDGRGIFVSSVALNTAGLDSIRYAASDGVTSFEIVIPEAGISAEIKHRIDAELLAEIQGLPSFPPHIQQLIRICNSPDADLKKMSDEIGRDAGIAGQVIRLANSGGFAGGRVSEIHEAVKILGLSNIAGLLMKVGAYTILEEKYGSSDDLIVHPVRVAAYSRILARKNKLSSIADQTYVAGLLHDIGKIVLFAKLKRKGIKSVFDQMATRRDRLTIINMEEISFGASHAVIGELLGRKWNFPDELCSAIGLHHTPAASPEATKTIVYTVYLSNAIADFQEGQVSFYSIEPDVLAFFNITTVDSFEMVAAALNQQFLAAG